MSQAAPPKPEALFTKLDQLLKESEYESAIDVINKSTTIIGESRLGFSHSVYYSSSAASQRFGCSPLQSGRVHPAGTAFPLPKKYTLTVSLSGQVF
jgi:hypothetical protein